LAFGVVTCERLARWRGCSFCPSFIVSHLARSTSRRATTDDHPAGCR